MITSLSTAASLAGAGGRAHEGARTREAGPRVQVGAGRDPTAAELAGLGLGPSRRRNPDPDEARLVRDVLAAFEGGVRDAGAPPLGLVAGREWQAALDVHAWASLDSPEFPIDVIRDAGEMLATVAGAMKLRSPWRAFASSPGDVWANAEREWSRLNGSNWHRVWRVHLRDGTMPESTIERWLTNPDGMDPYLAKVMGEYGPKWLQAQGGGR